MSEENPVPDPREVEPNESEAEAAQNRAEDDPAPPFDEEQIQPDEKARDDSERDGDELPGIDEPSGLMSASSGAVTEESRSVPPPPPEDEPPEVSMSSSTGARRLAGALPPLDDPAGGLDPEMVLLRRSGPRVSNADETTIKYYLKQALEAGNEQAIRDLMARAGSMRMDMSDAVLSEGATFLRSISMTKAVSSVETLVHYLKQAMEQRKRPLLEVALSMSHQVDLGQLQSLDVGRARKVAELDEVRERAYAMLRDLRVEHRSITEHYLRQALRDRSRTALKLALDNCKAPSSSQVDPQPEAQGAPADEFAPDPALVKDAVDLLTRLDTEALLLFYVESAMKLKEADALGEALDRCSAAGMVPEEHKVLAEAQATLADVRRRQKKSERKTGLRSWFSRSSLNDSASGAGASSESLPPMLLFGAPLAPAVERSRYVVPEVCYVCIEYLREHGLKEPGLFRVPGNKDDLEDMKIRFEKGEAVELTNVHDAASLLKNYLRSLEQPLVPFGHYKHWQKLAAEKQPEDPQRLQRLRDLCANLPQHNRVLFSYLLTFLHEVTEHSDSNLMPAHNLAIVWAPNILKAEVETMQAVVTELPQSISLLTSAIEFAQIVVDPPPRSMLKNH